VEETSTPDPFETVNLLKSDFELLQKVADYAVEDTLALGELLGLTCPQGMAPREFFHTICLAKVGHLMATQGIVDGHSQSISEAAARFGNKTKDFDGGMKGLKVGEKITDPALLARLGLHTTRAERREAANRMRRNGRS
jgi:hypothetical protein